MINNKRKRKNNYLYRIKKQISTFILALCVVFSGLSNFNYTYFAKSEAKSNRDISEYVYNLTVDNRSVNAGENVKVYFQFNEEKGDIKEGDYIVVNWTNRANGEAFFEGFVQNIPLMIQGKHVGDVVVEIDKATITFNSNINNLMDVDGWACFDLLANNDSASMDENTQSSNITSGNKTVRVDITKPASGTVGVFYYKTGAMYPEDVDHVRWWLNINTNKNPWMESGIYIEDIIQPGQILDIESFEITLTYSDGFYKVFKGSDAIKQFQEFLVGSTITTSFDNAPGKIIVNIPKEHVENKLISISYTTKVENKQQKTFYNNTKASYQEWDQEKVDMKEFNAQVENVSADAGITGTIGGELKIFKMLKETKEPIENVTFVLTRQDGGEILEGKREIHLVTNKDGMTNIKGLPVGEYQVKEKVAPKWIELDLLNNPSYTFEVKSGDTEGTFLSIENQLKLINIDVKKEWVGKSQDEIQVTLFADKKAVRTEKLNQNNHWKATFSDLPEYDLLTKQKIEYTIDEEEISGYKKSISGNQDKGFVIINIEQPDLMISKKVIGTYANFQKEFEFDINITLEDGTPLSGEYYYEGTLDPSIKGDNVSPENGMISFENGNSSFKLAHGQRIQIKDLPYGSQYKITERQDNSDLYNVTFNGVDGSDNGVINEDKVIDVVNKKEIVPPTGIDQGKNGIASIVGSIIAGILIVIIIVGNIVKRRTILKEL
ncbi:Collagen binding domain-containing protein [Granulicatella balaenopterae]|uniref:Collagen binding domain-containing protein n=1 Tax=Granulicatella balaenopterae TaxID=137733 RepID=A0A1H9LSD1_9LACT|nr:Cna B-type domain-containing protein [Granulicatella balaenopterae]SER14127.1 Collagen binding domain-containing protein [Granulicatella balaenopterae]